MMYSEAITHLLQSILYEFEIDLDVFRNEGAVKGIDEGFRAGFHELENAITPFYLCFCVLNHSYLSRTRNAELLQITCDIIELEQENFFLSKGVSGDLFRQQIEELKNSLSLHESKQESAVFVFQGMASLGSQIRLNVEHVVFKSSAFLASVQRLRSSVFADLGKTSECPVYCSFETTPDHNETWRNAFVQSQDKVNEDKGRSAESNSGGLIMLRSYLFDS
eukprot:TRINITY_DN14674_c0_g1_i1.p1 TRINITY_DN14674_c0_g1~~TRINITY_DN14674_c0_g1_i1.p1  ORF type:complete len:221 (+),score=46.44 TRINITY_DN14674_c0_g1_i1:2-664(+)